MANPILKNEIIENGLDTLLEKVNGEFERMVGNLTTLRSGYVQTAQTIGQNATANSNNAEALSKESAALSAVEDGIKKVDSTTKMLIEDKKRLNEEARKYKKLTDEEKESVKKLSSDLEYYVKLMHSSSEANRKLGQLYAKNVAQIDIQKKSYNELYQTFNAINEALKRMTTEERNSTDAGKALTSQAKRIRDTLNEMQQSVGNYALNVGNYMSAMNGLKFQTQQIMREIPSAVNLQQFFLAISNNVPMFAEAVARYNKELPKIKEQISSVTAEIAKQNAELATLNVESSEYAVKQAQINDLQRQQKQLQSTAVSGWKAIGKSILSWQTLLLAALVLLQKLPGIIKSIGDKFKDLTKQINLGAEKFLVMAEANKNMANVATELDIIIDRLRGVSRGTDEWINGINTINKLTGLHINALNTEIDKVASLVEEYKDMAKAIEVNNIVSKKLADAEARSAVYRHLFYDPDASAEEERRRRYDASYIQQILGEFVSDKQMEQILDLIEDAHSTLASTRDEARKTLDELYFKYITVPGELQQMWKDMYQIVDPSKYKEKGSKEKQPSEQSTSDRYWEAEQELLEAQKRGYDLERSLAGLNRDKERDELINWYVDQRLALDENLKNEFISQQKYDAEIQELDRQNKTLREGITRKYWDEINKINREEAEKALKAREDRTIREINAITAVELKASSKRVRNTAQEAAKNNVLVENLNRLLNARKELIALDIASDETRSIEERTKALEKLNKEISKYALQLDFSKRLGTYSSLSDIITKNFDVSAGGKKSILANIIGEDAMKAAAESLGEGFEDWVDGQFETWMNSATQAVSTWYSTTMGYINDLISAYVELANAKAEAAKEATDAAQEEYEKEKALLEAGYASRVEATWAEYQEKKAAQEKAEEDAKAAAKAQQEINNLSTMGSLITAAANIWKTFTEIPVVGIPLAIAATGTMFGAFLAAKIKANEVSKYGEGGFEVLEGGSHASGHDIDLGVNNRKGRRMRAEGKEGLGIFSRRAMAHYGANNIEAMVNSVNRLEFEGNAAKRMSLERSVGMAVLSAPRTDLHRVESDLHKLVSYGSRSRTVNADGSVTEIRKNAKIVYKNG